MEDRKFYVYAYFRPWNGEPCYIGKGHGTRWLWHQKKGENHPNKHFASIFKKAEGPIPALKVRECLTEKEAFGLEIALIRILGRANSGGVLVNLTDGGEGVLGRKLNAEERKRISEKMKERFSIPEEREKLLMINKGRKASPETIKKLRMARQKLYEDENERMKRGRKGHKGNVYSEESKLKMKLAAQKRCASEEFRALMSTRAKKAWSSPERREIQRNRAINAAKARRAFLAEAQETN